MHPSFMNPQARSRVYSRRITASLIGIVCFHALLYTGQYNNAVDNYTTYSDRKRLNRTVTHEVEICKDLTHRIAGYGYCVAAEEFYKREYMLQER